MTRIGAFATIVDEQRRVLLCHRADSDFWGQPGGGMEPGETPWQAVAREVREETGLHCAVERLTGVYSWPTEGELILSFLCRTVGGVVSSSNETPQVAYFSLDRLPPNLFAEHAERIRDALADEIGTVLRMPGRPSAVAEIRAERST
jgi:8-oxo-dGTP pyrophosphatase MutT (NUDIX family)